MMQVPPCREAPPHPPNLMGVSVLGVKMMSSYVNFLPKHHICDHA